MKMKREKKKKKKKKNKKKKARENEAQIWHKKEQKVKMGSKVLQFTRSAILDEKLRVEKDNIVKDIYICSY